MQSPTPGSLYRHTTKQFSHSSRRFNCSNSKGFEILGLPHRCACATKGFVLCHSLPPAPGFADSKAPEPFSTLWPWKMLTASQFYSQMDTKEVQSVCSLAGPRSTSYNNSILEVSLDKQKYFWFKGKPHKKSSRRHRDLKHSKHFISNHVTE